MKETILRLFEEQRMACLDEATLPRLHALVVAALPEVRVSRTYLIRVVAAAGKPVLVKDPYASAGLPEPYRSELEGLLKFDTLENAEATLRNLSDKLSRYRDAEDRRGMECVRSVVLLGKRRAAASARRMRDQQAKSIKWEIAEWFTLWLYDPSSFFNWLELRKQSPGYRVKAIDRHPGG